MDPNLAETRIAPPKSIGHGKVMPPNTREAAVIITYLEHMSFKVGTRMRRHDLVAQTYFIGLRTYHGWLGDTYRTVRPTQDAAPMLRLCRQMLREHWSGEGVHQVQVTALDPRPLGGQLELFTEVQNTRARTNEVMDAINRRFGEFTLAPARLLDRSDMPNVIAPAWKPHGHRKSV